MKQKKKFYWFDVFGIILYYVPSYFLYAFAYDLTHEISHWGTRINIDYGRSPEIHFLKFITLFIGITVILIRLRQGNKGLQDKEIIIKRVAFGIIWTLAFLPLVFLLNYVNNAW